jgi:hypothetical protein
MAMERIATPATPNTFDYENDDPDLHMRCVGKSMTFQSKTHLAIPNIKPWLRSPILNSKRKNVSPRPSEPSSEEEQNTTKDTRRTKQIESTTFPAIVTKDNTKGTSSMCCKKPRKEGAKQRKKDEMRHSLPRMKTRQQLGWLESELPNIITGKMEFNYIPILTNIKIFRSIELDLDLDLLKYLNGSSKSN